MPEGQVLLAERSHPLYDANLTEWTLLFDSIKGGSNFINDDNLFSHRLEDATDYDERLERAYYLNFCEALPSLYNFYIFKEEIERPADEELEVFRKNCDGKGTTITDFIAKAGFLAKVYGVMHIVVDVPTVSKARVTRKDVKEKRLVPYLSMVRPTQLKDWSLDERGDFNWVLIEYTGYDDFDPKLERKEITYYKLITTENWEIQDSEGAPMKFLDKRETKGTNDLGFIPIVTLYHKSLEDDKIGESLLKDIVYINRAIMNWCSCIDEQIERQTFSQLIYPDDGSLAEKSESGDDPLHKTGTSSIFTFPANASHPPQFISPNVETVETIWKLIIDHIKEIYRLSGLVGSSDDMYISSSGRSAQIGFLGVNAALADTSSKYEKCENELSKIAYLQMGKTTEEYQEVIYPKVFDIASLREQLDAYFRIMEKNFSPTLNKELMKGISRDALPLATPAIKATIESDIDSGTGIVEPPMKAGFGGGAGEAEPKKVGKDGKPIEKDGQGNPAASKVGDTFVGKEDQETKDKGHKPVK
jgi:hypothetical protein